MIAGNVDDGKSAWAGPGRPHPSCPSHRRVGQSATASAGIAAWAMSLRHSAASNATKTVASRVSIALPQAYAGPAVGASACRLALRAHPRAWRGHAASLVKTTVTTPESMLRRSTVPRRASRPSIAGCHAAARRHRRGGRADPYDGTVREDDLLLELAGVRINRATHTRRLTREARGWAPRPCPRRGPTRRGRGRAAAGRRASW